MSRFKKGDKALVVGGRSYLGQEVEIVEWLSPGESVDFGGGPIMFDTRVNYGCWLVTPDGEWSTLKRDKWLMPLKGDGTPQEIRQQELTS